MNAATASTIRLILAAPWQQRRNARGLWTVVLICSLCCSASVALFAWSLFMNPELAASLRHSAAVTGRIAVAALLLAWWAVIVSNLLEQNHPTFARLVPQQPAQLRIALVTGWAGLVAFTSLLLYPGVPDMLGGAVGAALVLAAVAVGVRWPLLLIVVCGVSLVPISASESPGVSEAIAFGLAQWRAQRLAISATGLAATIVVLVVLIQDGGRRHAANYAARRDRTLRRQAAGRGEQPLRPRRCGFLASVVHSPYHAWLRYVLASSRSSPLTRAMLGLGPGLHWTRTAIALVVTAVLILGAVAVMESAVLVFPEFASFVPVILSSLAIGAMFGIVSPAMQVQSRLHQTHREQALLALLPGVPRLGRSNRSLAWLLSAQFLLAWICGLATMLMFSELAWHLGRLAFDMSYDNARALMVLASLPLLTLQWRRWARLPAPTSLNAGGPALLGLGLAGVAVTGQAMGWCTLAEAGVAFALAAFAWCALRWWRMGQEPSAFPVGRLA